MIVTRGCAPHVRFDITREDVIAALESLGIQTSTLMRLEITPDRVFTEHATLDESGKKFNVDGKLATCRSSINLRAVPEAAGVDDQ